MRQLSAHPDNVVFGLVRNKVDTDKKIEAELPGRKNIHIFEADVTDYAALQKAVDYVAAATGGSLEYIIANAAIKGSYSTQRTFGELSVVLSRITRIWPY